MKKANLYWPVYKNLEKEILELSFIIYFDDAQFKYIKKGNKQEYTKTPPYSLKIGDLLIRCCTEIEALIQEITVGQEEEIKSMFDLDKNEPITIGFRLKYINNLWALDKKLVNISCPSMFFQKKENQIFAPFNYENGDVNDYYSAYNAIKHDRNFKTIYKGNIRFLLRAMAALYLLNIYYKDEVVYLSSMSAAEFDVTLGSEIFSIEMSPFLPYNLDSKEFATAEHLEIFVYLIIHYFNPGLRELIDKKVIDLKNTNLPQKAVLNKKQEIYHELSDH